MRYRQGQITTIHFPRRYWAEMIDHCRRKLQGDYLPGEGPSPKAFGLIGGKVVDGTLVVEVVVPLRNNIRDCGANKITMDNAMHIHAVPSVTPLEQRGWVADPQEVDIALKTMQGQGLQLIGNYHMHRVAWEHDPTRDTPTKLDTILGGASRMFMFIVSMVNPQAPVVRAFFEGLLSLELPVEIV